MKRSALILAMAAAVRCGSNRDVQPIVIDLTQKSATPTPPGAPPPTAVPRAASESPAGAPGPQTAAVGTPARAIVPTPRPAAAAADRSPESVVEGLLAAYNRRDLEGLLAFYAEDAKIYDRADEITQTGLPQIRELYARSFAGPVPPHAVVISHMVQGSFVVDQQEVSGLPRGPIRQLAIYEIREGKIVNAWLMR